MEGSNPVSLDQEHQPDEFATSLRRKLRNLSPLPSRCCIYRVPECLRHENARAYTPKVVSIGPLHRGAEDLKAMEKHKMLYLKSFLKRTKLSMEDYVEFMKQREQKILWRNYSKEAACENDRIFNKPWKIMDIRYDMMLLENQLPFFLFEDIFDLAKLKVLRDNVSDGDCPSIEKGSLIKLTYEFFKFKAYWGDIEEIFSRINSSKIKHFVDFFRKCHVPRPLPTRGEIQTLTIPNLTELYEAGIKFEVKPTGGLFDIQFCEGTLVIPHLIIRKFTESFILNLLAFEQCHMLECYINDYVFIIDRLIDTTRAVQLLVQSGVIESKLPDNQEVVTSIDKLVCGSIFRCKHFYFNDLCDGFNAYCSNPWNTWMSTLKQQYFSFPLTIFAVAVATAVFILTVIQSVFVWSSV
ncbi:hypothetical protein TIFTF001_048174 [Ficus carica]|uniref:Uncharacterized protein n=1 Tax=Ficus carica TaxID=3494 RepID=A0AA88A0W3_FICCA|nr:hypothetical protein TIFTF001_048174 [Ficus carica]